MEIQEEEYNRTSKPPLERKVSFDEKVKYIDRPASTENLLDGDEETVKEKQVAGVENEGVSDEGLAADDYLQLVREPTNEEKQVELKVQQKIEALRKGEQVSFWFINPLTPRSDQHINSPDNSNTLLSRQVMRIKKIIN